MIDDKLKELERAVTAICVEKPELADEGERMMDAALLAYGIDPEPLKAAADADRAALLGQYRTKTGRILTDADIEVFAEEAERGYEVRT